MALCKRNLVLTDEEIINSILKYIDENIYNHAVMIDGEWGCGKTYFVREALIPAIAKYEEVKPEEKKRRIIYTSLYGVNSVDEISKQIIVNTYLEKVGKAKGLIQTSSKIFGAALSLLPAFGIDIDVKDLSGKLSELLQVKNSILVFDDLERCDCPLNEVLGYINTFVEQEGIKVILIANEKEIGHITSQANQELRYLVATQCDIKLEEKHEKSRSAKIAQEYHVRKYGQQPPEQPVQIDINTLQKRIEYLFGQNEAYERVKEKLIGHTIHYYPELSKVLVCLINGKGIDSNLKELLQERLTFFEEYMINEGHSNLRTFQFYLSKIQGLYDVISKLESEEQQAFLKYIIQYCFKICVACKSGIYKYEWSSNEEYGFKSIGRIDVFGSNLNFRFVDDYIVGSALNISRVERMLVIYENEYIKKDNQELDGLRKLELNWYVSTDADIEIAITQIMNALDEDKYDPDVYTRIINVLLRLEAIGFSKEHIPCAVSKMKINLGKQTSCVHLDRGFSLDPESEYKERYVSIMDELQAEADKKLQEQSIDTIEKFLSEADNWAEDLYQYVRDNFREVADQTGFLSNLNIDHLIDKLSKSKSFDLHAFRSCILQLYGTPPIEPALQQDGPRLIVLKDGIEKLDTKGLDKVQLTQIKYLLLNLDKAIMIYDQSELEPAEENIPPGKT